MICIPETLVGYGDAFDKQGSVECPRAHPPFLRAVGMGSDASPSRVRKTPQLGNFAIVITFEADDAVVAVSGDVDVMTAPTLASVLRGVTDAGHLHVVLDVADVSFIGGAGLGSVSVAATELDDRGGNLTVRAASPAAHRLFSLPGADVPTSVTFVRTRQSELGAEQQPGDHTAILTSPQSRLTELAHAIAVPTSAKVIDAALQLVTVLATATVDGADGVSVTLARDGQMVTAASSNDTVLRMDEHQYRTGEGPCLAAASLGHWFHVESLADEQRWPDFVPLARSEGIASVLSTPLLVADTSLGALNIYSTTDRAFGHEQQELAALFATQAATILTDAGVERVNADFAKRISAALLAREVIAQAQGVVMARQHVSSSEAAAILHRLARTAELSVLAQATEVVAATLDDSDASR